MQCPACRKPAISFFDWAKGLRWYATDCDACGASLKANGATLIGFTLTVAAMVAVLFSVEEPRNYFVSGVVVLLGAYVVFAFAGGYVRK